MKILRKKSLLFFEEIAQQPHIFWQFVKSLEYGKKNLKAELLFMDFFKVFGSTQSWIIIQILLVYSLPKETVTALIILYDKGKQWSVHLMETPTSSILSRESWKVIYYSHICLVYEYQTSIDLIKENIFTLKSSKRKLWQTQTTGMI